MRNLKGGTVYVAQASHEAEISLMSLIVRGSATSGLNQFVRWKTLSGDGCKNFFAFLGVRGLYKMLKKGLGCV